MVLALKITLKRYLPACLRSIRLLITFLIPFTGLNACYGIENPFFNVNDIFFLYYFCGNLFVFVFCIGSIWLHPMCSSMVKSPGMVAQSAGMDFK